MEKVIPFFTHTVETPHGGAFFLYYSRKGRKIQVIFRQSEKIKYAFVKDLKMRFRYDIIMFMKMNCADAEQRVFCKENREKFRCFCLLLQEYNKKYNLTAITDEKEIYYKHFVDSVAGEEFFPKNACVAEVGSGAGFPSIPLKVVRPDLKFTLIESTGKKCEFLRIVCEKLGLSDMTVLGVRAEDAGKDSHYREKFDVCTARAVARLNTLAEYCMPFVKKEGVFVAYKGNAEEEIKEAERALSLLGGGKIERYSYELPESFGSRTLVVAQKREKTPEKFPRGRGKERSSPII